MNKNIDIYNENAIDMSSLRIGAGTVDLIFTDPPYSKEYHYCYEWLAREAARALKPDGFIIAYVGPYWKDIIMEYFGQHLQYFYDFICAHKGNTSILWPRKIISGYKSILCYHLKESLPLPKTNVLGRYDGTGGDKRFHKWGQDYGMARYFIDCFTHESDLVVDYFLGGGTTAEVCKRINRRFIGFEIDKNTFDIAKRRLNGILGPFEKSRQYEMEI